MRNMYMRTPMRALAAVAALMLLATAGCGQNPAGETSSVMEDNSVVSGVTSGAEEESPAPLPADKYSPKCEVDDVVYRTGLCISELQTYYNTPVKQMRERLQLYKELGFETIRGETYWASFELNEGTFNNPSQQLFFHTAREEGFHFKMILGTFMAVPNWYYAKYPDSRMKDHTGTDALMTVSYFAPNLREYMTEALDQMMAYMQKTGLLDVIDTLPIDCGPAGEGLYPAGWTQSPGGADDITVEDRFWGYDVYSQQNFRETMQGKYGTISAANAAWGKSYSSFDEVEVPKPGGPGGGIWADYLQWYRDSNNNFVEEQVKMYQAAVDKYTNGRIKLIMYLPGHDIRDEEWQQALESGDGSVAVRIMADTRHKIELAREYGCWLQFTGFEVAGETKYIRDYMDANGAGDIPYFGENAGQSNIVKNSSAYFAILRQNGMAGVDLTHSRFLFENYDGMTPISNIDKLKVNMRILKNYLRPEAG